MNVLKKFSFILLITLVVVGCSSKEEQPTLRLEADQKLHQMLKNDYGYDAMIRRVGQTAWVYVAQEESFYQIEGSDIPLTETPRDYVLQFIDSSFKNDHFVLEYDVIPATRTPRGNGISTKYSASFNELSRNLLNALTRTYLSSEEPPDFFVVIVADIKNGILAKRTIYQQDLKKTFSGGLPPEEYSMRIVNDIFGSKGAVGDAQGKHLDMVDITWPMFLMDQAKQRIRFKFQQSDFPPQETPQSEILKQVATTLLIYDFTDYSAVVLKDLRNDTSQSFDKEHVQAMRQSLGIPQQGEEPKGQIITFDFSQFLKPAAEKDAGAEPSLP